MTQNQDRLAEDLQKQVATILLDAIRMVVREVQGIAEASPDGQEVVEMESTAIPQVPQEELQVGSSEPVTPGATGGAPPAPAPEPIMDFDPLTQWPERQDGESDERFRQRVVQTQKIRQAAIQEERETPPEGFEWLRQPEVEPEQPKPIRDIPTVESRREPTTRDVPAVVAEQPRDRTPPEDGYDDIERDDRRYPDNRAADQMRYTQDRADEEMNSTLSAISRFMNILSETCRANTRRIESLEVIHMQEECR